MSYWDNQPVQKYISHVSSKICDLKLKKVQLPLFMNYSIVNYENINKLNVICEFLNINYDKNIIFNLDLIKFMMGLDGFIVVIFNNETNNIYGVVCVNFEKNIIYEKTEIFALCNFMCVHKKCRNKNIAKLLMDITKQVCCEKNIEQGYFKSDKLLYMPQSSTLRKYIRPLNYKKLLENKFIKNAENNIEKIENTHKKFVLNDNYDEKYVEMNENHIDEMYELYNDYVLKYNFYCFYTKDEFRNLFTNNIVKCYVVIENNKVIDFFSYIIIKYKNDVIAGNLFLYTTTNVYGDSMMNNILKILVKNNIDVLITYDNDNISDIIMSEKYDYDENSDYETYDKVYEHKFLKNKKEYLYLYNWKNKYLNSNNISCRLFI